MASSGSSLGSEFYLIEDKEGFVLPLAHASRILQGTEKAILWQDFSEKIADRPIYLLSDKKAYGIIQLSLPEQLELNEAVERQPFHQMSEQEIRTTFPNKRVLFQYDVRVIEKFEQPKNVPLLANIQMGYVKDFEFENTTLSENDSFVCEPMSERRISIWKLNSVVILEKGKDVSSDFPQIVEEAKDVSQEPFIAEAYVEKDKAYLYDLKLWGEKLVKEPLIQRKKLMQKHLLSTDHILINPYLLANDSQDLQRIPAVLMKLPYATAVLQRNAANTITLDEKPEGE